MWAIRVHVMLSGSHCVPRVLALSKYSHGRSLSVGSVAAWGLSAQFVGKAQELLGATRAFNTLRVAKSALNKVAAVEITYGLDLSFPWNLASSANFVMACVEQGLRANTIRNYCSQLKQAHLDGGFQWDVDMSLANRLLRGHDNLTSPSAKKIAVHPGMLFHLREHLRKDKSRCRHDTRILWLLITFMWCGSFRVGELLAPTETGFVENQSFLGKRLLVKRGVVEGVMEEFLSVRLLDPKEARSRSNGGVDVELFSTNTFYDPGVALAKFRERMVFPIAPDLPVFR